MSQTTWSRRKLLQFGGVSALALGAGSLAATRLQDFCGTTPAQSEGPFYPVRDQADKNTDLTFVEGRDPTHIALGEIIYLSGKVVDQHCVPVAGVVVDIWQACASGRYDHPGDTRNRSALDPNFQYWGIAATAIDGTYSFKTIKPGHYEAGPGWVRPPHIHFKVSKLGYQELITQLYFAGNRYNSDDRILRRVPTRDRASVVRELRPRPLENNRAAFDMSFDITIERLI
jgi:protocatechuate 3,4-dioxygenase beta subunit